LPENNHNSFILVMPGVGKLLKQAQKMQKLMEEFQPENKPGLGMEVKKVKKNA